MALVLATLGFGVILGGMIMLPAGHSPLRDEAWRISVAVLFISGVLGAASVLEAPGGSGKLLAAAASLALLGSLTLAVHGTSMEPGLRLHCLAIGSGLGLLTLIAITLLSGRLWPRFQNPLWGASVLATGVSLAFLCTHCDRSDALHIFSAHLPAVFVVYGVARLLGRMFGTTKA